MHLSKSIASAGKRTHAKGQASRETILLTAARLATLKGLEGLSIGDLADEVGMSKSGLYAHFKSKEELELATIQAAIEIFEHEVLKTALAAPAGLARLRALIESFLAYIQGRVFPGGCFFAAVANELGTLPKPARDAIVAVHQNWFELFKQCVLDAQANGEVDSRADVLQTVFEIKAMLLAANFQFVMFEDDSALTRARKGVDVVLARVAAGGESNQKR